jgi:hypothetical protein
VKTEPNTFPIEAPPSAEMARIMEYHYQADHVQQNANRAVAVGRLLSMARALRENPPATLSPEMKDYYLACVIQIADEFLEGR